MKPTSPAPALPPANGSSPAEPSAAVQLSARQIKTKLTHLSEVLGRRYESYQAYAQTAGFGVKIGDKTCFEHNQNCVVLSAQ